ncbi:hypothetical protein VTK73DRAFT_9699 [Phialemonium thermophilum]|uniref:60S ribosomal export protein NMD3 n=1 Tax=Phialemonium thermophilum TaxID=223376 RepID=A0ABR3W0T0_9PEZI
MSYAMDLDAPVPMRPVGTAQTGATILCCNCGTPIDGTTSTGALCYDCIKSTVDVSKGIQREGVLHYCRDCERWLMPPSSWVMAAPESRELLALCLKKLKGLSKVRIVDASFIWTEPHSRRIKVKITVQDSVSEGVLLQQSFEVVFVVAYQQCPECLKSFSAHVWRASVQVRQKVTHKRTGLYLEQVILKHGAHREAINIKEAKDGIDFFFSARNQAEKFVDFLHSVVPIRVKKSQQLISEDIHTSTKSYKFTFSAEIIPICKDDLVVLPLKLARQMGNISPLVLCHRVGVSVYFLDPNTLQTADLSSPIYWRSPFPSLAEARDLVEFIVMDIEPTGVQKGKMILSEVTVARSSDLGVNDKTYFARTHLGHLLHAGDSVLGYMITGSNFNSSLLDDVESSHQYGSTVPDVILVKKHYPNRRRNRRRNWKLKRMAKQEDDTASRRSTEDNDYEMFLRDVEEDEELRAALALYKNTNKNKKKAPQDADAMSVAETEMTDGGEDDGPKINMDELLDDFDELDIQDE